MKTKVFRLKDKDFIVGYRRFPWSVWHYAPKRFLSKKNAEEYAARLKWKFMHPKKYRKMLTKYNKYYFLGHD